MHWNGFRRTLHTTSLAGKRKFDVCDRTDLCSRKKATSYLNALLFVCLLLSFIVAFIVAIIWTPRFMINPFISLTLNRLAASAASRDEHRIIQCKASISTLAELLAGSCIMPGMHHMVTLQLSGSAALVLAQSQSF
jgi:hypothetical protein